MTLDRALFPVKVCHHVDTWARELKQDSNTLYIYDYLHTFFNTY
jgi:hypothetical protein